MSSFEDKHVYTYPLQPMLWQRFIDETFLTWTHESDTLIQFHYYLNNCQPTIKLALDYSFTEIILLFLRI